MKFGLPGAPLRQARDGTIEIEPLERAYGWAKDAMLCSFTFPEAASQLIEEQRSRVAEEFLDQEKPGSWRIWKFRGFGKSKDLEQKIRAEESEQGVRAEMSDQYSH